jgi:hypothetical protein
MISLMVVPSSYTNHAWLGQFFAGACTVGAVYEGVNKCVNKVCESGADGVVAHKASFGMHDNAIWLVSDQPVRSK